MNVRDRELLQLFLGTRTELIESLSSGKIDKSSFLRENYVAIKRLNLKPFTNISSYEEALFNYQYYNVMAKVEIIAYNMQTNKNKKKQRMHINRVNNLYDLKDRATKAIVEIFPAEDLEAYYVESDSKRLYKKLFEIVVLNKPFAVFHSMDQEIFDSLNDKGCFSDILKVSLIDSYINCLYK